MGFITVERHVFYVVPHEYAGEQTHLHVKNVRLPMSRQSADRTIKYLDDSVFGALPFSRGIKTEESIKDFYLGKGHPWPKLIVANVTRNELYTRPEMKKLMFQRWKQHMNRGAQQGLSVNQPQFPKLEESKWGGWSDDRQTHAQRMAAFHKKTELSAQGSREKHLGMHGDDHRPHGSQQVMYNEIWLLPDPSKPGKVLVPDSRMRLLAKQVFSSSATFKNVVIAKNAGRNEIIEQGAVILLGVGYKLHYHHKRAPIDAVVVPAVYDRVHAYLSKFMKKAGTVGDNPNAGAINTYYALGTKELPARSKRYKATPRGRVRKYATFHGGKGIQPVAPGASHQMVPLFTVKARNIDEAQMKAQMLLNRKRWLADLNERDKWVQYGLQWYESGRRMITVGAMRMLNRSQQ